MFEYWVLRTLNGGIVPDSEERLLQEIVLREILRKVGIGVVDWIVAGTGENEMISELCQSPPNRMMVFYRTYPLDRAIGKQV